MGSGRSNPQASQLWQIPLLLVALPLFLYAGYKWIDPKPPLSFDQKIKLAQLYIKYERSPAAIELLNKMLEDSSLEAVNKGTAHLLLAEALEAGQKSAGIDLPENHVKIVEQIRTGISLGAIAQAPDMKRMGDSYMALEHPNEALTSYVRAIALDPALGAILEKKIVQLQTAAGQTAQAQISLGKFLQQKDLTASERAWALGEQAHILIQDGRTPEAETMLNEAAKLDQDVTSRGTVAYWLGYCHYKAGHLDQAERDLRSARELLTVKNSLDADASWLLGRIFQERNEPEKANSFYNIVLVSHPEQPAAALARLGRGVCRVMLKEDEAGLTDLHDVVNIAIAKPQAAISSDVVAGLGQAASILSANANYQGALELLAYEQMLVQAPSGDFFARLAKVYEKRADQVEAGMANVKDEEVARLREQVRDLRTKAGDALVAVSKAMTLADDKSYGDALWHGVDLFDRASNVQRVIWALELFAAERPDDPLAAEATLRLGRAYQAAGQFDKAISAFQRTQFRYPKSLAASKAAVPLAQAYVAKGPDGYVKAEKVLLSVLESNPVLTPEAEEFRGALLELAQLYYRTNRYEEAIARLEELTQRYPNEPGMAQLLFLIGDSYRKSAGLIDVKQGSDPREAETARQERLGRAKKLFDRVVEMGRLTPPSRDQDKLQLKLAHFYRADCLYDLGQYEDAIKLYDAAAFRYQDDPSALAAYVQIVNSYCALGKMDQAKAANERAKWLLKRMPPQAFADGSFAMPKNYWEQWLKWTGQVGIW